MRYRWLLTVVAFLSLGLIVLTFKYPHEMISPGALIPAHQELTTDCFACHTPLFGASAERCIHCHAVADIGIRTTAGDAITAPGTDSPFHQELVKQDCIACHVDHAGSRLADNPHTFSHLLLKPKTRDQCENCHTAPENEIHKDLTTTCYLCHSTTAWTPATFDHDDFFELNRDHDASCVTCHENNVHTEFTCYGCHEHTPTNIRREHEDEGIRDFDNCVACHRNAHDEPEHGDRRSEGRGKRDG